MAEAVGEKAPQQMQRLLYSTRWAEDGTRDELRRFVVEQFSDEEGVGVVVFLGLKWVSRVGSP